MKTSKILRRAGDVSRERGWCQGVLEYDEGGEVCLRGATGIASGGTPESAEADGVLDPLRTVIDRNDETVSWNDTPGRTHAEVLIALDAAYVLALQEEGVDVSGTDWEEL